MSKEEKQVSIIERKQLHIHISRDSLLHTCLHVDCFKDALTRVGVWREGGPLGGYTDIILCDDHFALMVVALREFGFKYKSKDKKEVRIVRAPITHEDWSCTGCIASPAKWHLKLTAPEVTIANVCSPCLNKLRERCAAQGMRTPEELLL